MNQFFCSTLLRLVYGHFHRHPIRIILNNVRWGLMDAKFAGEELLRKSAVPYTVVRPGGCSTSTEAAIILWFIAKMFL